MNYHVSAGVGTKVEKAYLDDIQDRTQKLNKKANDAIGSFQALVDEINRLKTDSTGTPVKQEVSTVANDMSNSSVMVTRMLTAQLQQLHEIVSPDIGPEADFA